jgi:5-methylcytosine-specific restriction endonuclease McrA
MRKPEGLTNIDHVIPRIAGGEDAFTNVVGACRCCNSGKAAAPLLHRLLDLRSERPA